MPLRHTTPLGAPCWIDLQTSDVARSQEFYRQLFGWVAEDPDPDFGGYRNFLADGVPVAGCMASDSQAPVTDIWSVYLATDDTAKTLDVASQHGGQVVVPAMQVGDLGTMGFLMDAGHAGVGLWQPDGFPGFGVLGEPGTPSWFELQTRDFEAAVTFYEAVFGWQTHPVGHDPDFRYSRFQDPEGQEGYAGIMDASSFLPDSLPAHWSVYFGVDDADVALQHVVDLGGAVLKGVQETPYGRLATAVDPTGARFKLVALPPGR